MVSEMKIIFFLISIISTVTVYCHTGCSPVYGSEPCAFLPAPPGKTPSCALHGLTYCEHPDHYPGQLIHFLIQKWRFDHSTLITSESREDFSSFFFPPPNPTYGPPNYHSYGPPAFNHHPTNYPEPIYIPKPQYPFQDYGNVYLPPNSYPVQNITGYPDRRQQNSGRQMNFKYSFPLDSRLQYQPQNYFPGNDEPRYGPYNNHIWRRRLENNYQRLKRSLKYKRSQVSIQERFEDGRHSNSTSSRIKRQSPTRSETLCRTRSQYIMPRAALNNKGNWMYVVNMPEVDNQYTQLVKSETCVSEICSGICSLPQGYSSRCEQKYIQKRLVALEEGGNQLYTDLFWIPSCCVCTISSG
ncbi:spatzle 5 Toll-1 receptor [Leptinotarsa decemlineata]|uniref:spatzle 5 Toll-1 receptor n=1 Tax=Leptinotarsa decemlineata TaxID=7539 RepID=UPI003D30CE82